MRGKLGVRARCRLHDRITPAGAGKTPTQMTDEMLDRDHPRRCGENRNKHSENRRGVGSPPQVRGKHYLRVSAASCAGITPAGAGKTKSRTILSAVAEDHPRRCGENALFHGYVGCISGSPPQVRGKLCDSSRFAVTPGITPAGAGKTLFFGRGRRTPADHPRRCGENSSTCCR